MPTFKNPTESGISYEAGGKIYNFPAGKNTGINIWIPYKELGLELIDENYPPVKSKVLLSGTFKFGAGTERKMNITHCDKYRIKIAVKKGTLMLYFGNSTLGAEITEDYETSLEWSCAPYLKLKGVEAGTEAKIYAEVNEP